MLLSDMLTNVRTVDDLYFFFDKTLPELKQSLTNLQLATGSGQSKTSVIHDGSQLDMFIRRCILSFNQLMFHDLQYLYEAFNLYKEGQAYSFR